MKKIKTMRLASILLIGTLLTTCLLGGTFAKYTAGASGSSSATVAYWSFRANDQEIAVSPQVTYDFKLFNTIHDADGTSTDEDVLAHKIAPGTSGSFKMTVENCSEVGTQYSIALVESNDSSIPIQYSIDGSDWSKSLTEIATDNLTDLTLAQGAKAVSYTLYWRWAFDSSVTGAPNSQTDESDSTIGHPDSSDVPSVMVTASITASQVD